MLCCPTLHYTKLCYIMLCYNNCEVIAFGKMSSSVNSCEISFNALLCLQLNPCFLFHINFNSPVYLHFYIIFHITFMLICYDLTTDTFRLSILWVLHFPYYVNSASILPFAHRKDSVHYREQGRSNLYLNR